MQKDAELLVLTLRQQSHDPDMPGRIAIPAWRVEAAAHGDVELCAAMDAHGEALLIRIWDRPRLNDCYKEGTQ